MFPSRIASSPTTIFPRTPASPSLRERAAASLVSVNQKQAIGWGYTAAFPRSTRQEMEDRLANDIEELQNDPKWQRLLLEMISAHIDSCSARQKSPSPDDSPPHTPTRAELLDEEERMKNYRPPTSSNVNAAGSAVLSYRFSARPDPLKLP